MVNGSTDENLAVLVTDFLPSKRQYGGQNLFLYLQMIYNSNEKLSSM